MHKNDQVSYTQRFIEDFLDQLANWAPKLIGALIILVVGYIVAKIVARICRIQPRVYWTTPIEKPKKINCA